MWPLVGRLTAAAAPRMVRFNPFDELVQLVHRSPVRQVGTPTGPISPTVPNAADQAGAKALADMIELSRLNNFERVYTGVSGPMDDLLYARGWQARAPISLTEPVKRMYMFNYPDDGARYLAGMDRHAAKRALMPMDVGHGAMGYVPEVASDVGTGLGRGYTFGFPHVSFRTRSLGGMQTSGDSMRYMISNPFKRYNRRNLWGTL